jgi:hypothetical protein
MKRDGKICSDKHRPGAQVYHKLWGAVKDRVPWIPAHSPQAKGRVERQFQTAQDRLVKGMRVAGVCTIEAANAYLREEFLPWWNRTLTVQSATAEDAHRPLGKEHDLAATRSHVEHQTAETGRETQAQARLDEQLFGAVWPLSAPGG